MRIPDDLKECVVFLCVKSGNRFSYRGTAFFVIVPSETDSSTFYIYLVTAKHCVERAKQHGSLFVRLNTKAGGFEVIEITEAWYFSENEGVDLAVLEAGFSYHDFQYKVIPSDWFVTDTIAEDYGIGIGDDLYLCGLFTSRHGSKRNIPIVRGGIIASMPEELLIDFDTGYEFNAYLAEVRSIGGLSGSPVFVFLNRGPVNGPLRFEQKFFLLGVVRGHWDTKRGDAALDFAGDDLSAVNKGIATITPSQELSSILYSDALVKLRRANDLERLRENAETLD